MKKMFAKLNVKGVSTSPYHTQANRKNGGVQRYAEIDLKAILQVLMYKALYDKSYLRSKTTMTSGEWTCLISFATAPLTCSERGGSEKFKIKIYVSSGIRTHAPPVHDRKVAVH